MASNTSERGGRRGNIETGPCEACLLSCPPEDDEEDKEDDEDEDAEEESEDEVVDVDGATETTGGE